MAKLILTEQEKAAKTYLDWSDEALGKALRSLALELGDDCGENTLKLQGAAFFLIGRARQIGATRLKLSLENVTHEGERKGDWQVLVRRTDAPQHKNPGDELMEKAPGTDLGCLV